MIRAVSERRPYEILSDLPFAAVGWRAWLARRRPVNIARDRRCCGLERTAASGWRRANDVAVCGGRRTALRCVYKARVKTYGTAGPVFSNAWCGGLPSARVCAVRLGNRIAFITSRRVGIAAAVTVQVVRAASAAVVPSLR